MTRTEIRSIRAQHNSSQTNVVHLASAANERIYVTGYSVTSSDDTTVAVLFIMGFSATGVTPTTSKVIATHAGLAPGGRLEKFIESEDALIHGATGEDVLLTMGAPTNGAVGINLFYYIIVD